jgi:hypothetical protein
MKMQRTNIHTGRVADSAPEAGMEMMPRNLRELRADFWTLQTRSPQALTCPSNATSSRHQPHISAVRAGNFNWQNGQEIIEPTVILSTCVMQYQIEVPVLRKQNTI